MARRKNVDVKGDKVIINLNKQFYNSGILHMAVNDFKNICDVKINRYIILKPKTKDIDINTIGYEFYNYLLGLIKTL